MPQLDSDAFTYSNGNLATASAAKWTKLSGFSDCVVASNQLSGSGGGDAGDVITSWAGNAADQYSQLTLAASADSGSPTVRSDAASTFYMAERFAGVTIWRVVGGSFTSIGTASVTWANGDVHYLDMQGTTLVCKQNGTVVATVLGENSIPSGKPGIWISGTAYVVDDWAAGDFAGGGGPTVAQELPAIVQELSGQMVGVVYR